MLDNVRCYVEECKFHDDENQGCTAASIEIMTNGSNVVGTSQGTLCETFIYKDYVHRYTTDELRRDEQQPDTEF